MNDSDDECDDQYLPVNSPYPISASTTHQYTEAMWTEESMSADQHRLRAEFGDTAHDIDTPCTVETQVEPSQTTCSRICPITYHAPIHLTFTLSRAEEGDARMQLNALAVEAQLYVLKRQRMRGSCGPCVSTAQEQVRPPVLHD